MQFLGNSVQKRVSAVQISNKPDILIRQKSKRLTDSESNASLGCRSIQIRWKFASETMAGVSSRFYFATKTTIQQLKNSSNNVNTVKSTAFGCRFGKNGVQRRELLRKSRITSRLSLTLSSSDPTPKLKTYMVKPRKRRFHFIECDRDWTIPWIV